MKINGDTKDIQTFKHLQKLLNIFQMVNQLSWTVDQTRKRYPLPEAMTTNELEMMIKLYMSYGNDLELIYNEFLKEKNSILEEDTEN